MNNVCVFPSFWRFSKTSYVTKTCYNTVRKFSWESHSNDQLIRHLTRTTQNIRYVPNRHLGWLLAPPLKPGQKGYKRQQKMYRRGHIFLVSLSFVVLYIMWEFGLLLPVPAEISEEKFHNIQRNEAERIRARKQMQDEELLRLAQLRKENVEKYFPQDSIDKTS